MPTGSELLFYGGLAVMGASALTALVMLIGFKVSGKRLRKRLDAEYGRKRH